MSRSTDSGSGVMISSSRILGGWPTERAGFNRPVAKSGAHRSMLGSWLETLPQAELAAVLASRRDVLTAPTPRDVSELADRLQHTNSVANAVWQLSAQNL